MSVSVPWNSIALDDSTHVAEKGSVVELPLWIALPLADRYFGFCRSHRGIVTLLPMRAFSSKIRDELHAGACAVNLNDVAQHYYHLGLCLSAV